VPEPGSSQSYNRYAYVRNSPVKFRDPSGHAECIDDDCNWAIHPVSGKVVQRGPTAQPQPSPLDIQYPLGREPTGEEIHELGRMIWNEEKGGERPAMTAAAWVAVNRVNSRKFKYPNKDLIVVLSAPNQFKGYPGTDPDLATWAPAVKQWAIAQDVASDVLSGQEPDPTNGALFFCNGCGIQLKAYGIEYYQVKGYNMYYYYEYVPYWISPTPTPEG